jgi:hypothetical protein
VIGRFAGSARGADAIVAGIFGRTILDFAARRSGRG